MLGAKKEKRNAQETTSLCVGLPGHRRVERRQLAVCDTARCLRFFDNDVISRAAKSHAGHVLAHELDRSMTSGYYERDRK